MSHPLLLDNQASFDKIMLQAASQPLLAIDTEFISGRFYDTRLGLIQIAWSRDQAYLIDPLEIQDTEAFAQILSARDILIIVHDGEQDLVLLREWCGVTAEHVFDTQKAAGFAGLRATLSLHDLLKTMIGVKINKSAQRTNWLQRPLAQKQLEYALDDVRYLPEIYVKLTKEARLRGHADWLEEEMADYVSDHWFDRREKSEAYESVKGRGRLSDQETLALRELAIWRDKEARRQDTIPVRIVSDHHLLTLAKLRPGSPDALQRVRVLDKNDARRYGDEILNAIEKGRQGDPATLPDPPQKPASSDVVDEMIDLPLALIKHICREGDIDISLVGSRADVVTFLHGFIDTGEPRGPLATGWRFEFAGRALIEMLEGRSTLGLDRHSFETRLVTVVPTRFGTS